VIDLWAERFGELGSRSDVYWTLHAVFVKRREDMVLFDQAFALFWRRRALIEKMMAMLSPEALAPQKPEGKPEAGALRVQEAFAPPRPREDDVLRELNEFTGRLTISDTETLKGRDFAQMSADEVSRAQALIARLRLPDDEVATRRFRPAKGGNVIDLRQTLRRSMRAGPISKTVVGMPSSRWNPAMRRCPSGSTAPSDQRREASAWRAHPTVTSSSMNGTSMRRPIGGVEAPTRSPW
jgi:uncharacterized protein with von Willebrand factor type A (vWA) domain